MPKEGDFRQRIARVPLTPLRLEIRAASAHQRWGSYEYEELVGCSIFSPVWYLITLKKLGRLGQEQDAPTQLSMAGCPVGVCLCKWGFGANSQLAAGK